MTAERPGGEPSPGEGLTAIVPSLANAGASAVTHCPGFYLRKRRKVQGEWLAECDRCGVLGKSGFRCTQTVIADE